MTHVKAVGTSGVEVRVADGTVYTAESLVVASGAWTNDVRINSLVNRVLRPALSRSSPTPQHRSSSTWALTFLFSSHKNK